MESRFSYFSFELYYKYQCTNIHKSIIFDVWHYNVQNHTIEVNIVNVAAGSVHVQAKIISLFFMFDSYKTMK